jgi:DNA-binding beta-propeller fold protein YncE
MNYYRLKLIDKDGAFKYSQVEQVSYKKTISLQLYPNPAGNTVTLAHDKTAVASIVIYNMAGNQVFTQPIKAGSMMDNINVSSLPAGSYILSYKVNNDESSVILIKK